MAECARKTDVPMAPLLEFSTETVCKIGRFLVNSPWMETWAGLPSTALQLLVFTLGRHFWTELNRTVVGTKYLSSISPIYFRGPNS
jgi:hypothetical protein